ncbi:anti-sigma factor [Paenibacillus sp. D2_2]|uniref:anti-sigma factor n=1 Tax=Paenibacillus sp. D2_2 TaxID=3073092 RepID=UPI002814CA7A|nr:anti-sigma factor [Paenibacillus sp. D2_2]WMT42342.1 anti-sigma factor [Paenibacillus sp. D2_2]
MKCSEAVEWMHRYLDHDLNDEESAQLFEHIRNCRDCAEEFDILKMLNSKLEQLPKVMPKINLVDSILPQLDEIDRARREEGSASEVLPGMKPLVAKSEEPAASRSRRQSPWRNRAFRAGALGVTAALVLGIFIYNYEPRTASDAEISVQSLSSSDMADNATRSDTTNSSSSDASRDAQSQLPQEGNNPAGDSNDSVLQQAGQQNDTAGKEDPAAARALTGNSDAGENSGSPATTSKQGSADTKDLNKSDMSASDKASSGQSDKRQSKTSPSVSGNTAASGATTSKVTKNDRSSDNDGQTVDGTEEPESTRYSIGGNIMGILAKDLWTSPDGGFTVEINDGHLYLYQNNADSINGRKLIADKPFDGVWVQGSWSEDSKSYQYEIDKDNVTSTYTLQTETDVTDPSVNNDQSQKNTTK